MPLFNTARTGARANLQVGRRHLPRTPRREHSVTPVETRSTGGAVPVNRSVRSRVEPVKAHLVFVGVGLRGTGKADRRFPHG